MSSRRSLIYNFVLSCPQEPLVEDSLLSEVKSENSEEAGSEVEEAEDSIEAALGELGEIEMMQTHHHGQMYLPHHPGHRQQQLQVGTSTAFVNISVVNSLLGD